MRVIGNHDATDDTLDLLRFVADIVAVNCCWYYRGSYHFAINDRWTVAITPQSAQRFRVQTCHLTLPHGRTYWARAADRNRLASLVRDAIDTVSQPA